MNAIVDSSVVEQSRQVITGWLWPVIVIVLAGIAGNIFERIVLHRLRKISERTEWRGDEIIVGALHGMITLWAVIAAASSVWYTIPVAPNIIELGFKIFKVLLIFSGTIVLSRIAVGFVTLGTTRDDTELPSASILHIIAKASVYLIGILIVLQSLGISITPLLTALGVGGLAVALALQDTLSNLFAGLHILASRKIRTGDFIRLDTGQEGFVSDITWRYTEVRALSNDMIIVPNAKLASALVVNYFQPEPETAVVFNMSVAYGSDLTRVEQVTIEVARQVQRTVEGAIQDFEPFIRYNAFGESSVNFSVIMRANVITAKYLMIHEFIKAVYLRYESEGLSFPFPTRTIHVVSDKSEPIAGKG